LIRADCNRRCAYAPWRDETCAYTRLHGRFDVLLSASPDGWGYRLQVFGNVA
jgi:hypothetical protein